jgi:hypothetical protein
MPPPPPVPIPIPNPDDLEALGAQFKGGGRALTVAVLKAGVDRARAFLGGAEGAPLRDGYRTVDALSGNAFSRALAVLAPHRAPAPSPPPPPVVTVQQTPRKR